MRKKTKNRIKTVAVLGAILLLALWLYFFKGLWYTSATTNNQVPGPDAVIANYGDEIKSVAKEMGFSPEYLAALCMLESGGRKPVPPRFEKHVYSRLKLVQLGMKRQYEHVKKEDLASAGDEAMQNLASSWGPFQLMGYKCLIYGINIRDLRGEEAVHWAAIWMKQNYGKYLAKGDYKSAFHIHNSGSPFPSSGLSKTHDPNYVNKGLQWMDYFKGKL